MSIIATVVKAALAVDQKVQGGVSKVAHLFATRNFDEAGKVESLAIVKAGDTAIKLERVRAQRAADLIAAHKKAMIRLHEGIDAELDLVDGRKAQEMGRARQYRNNAAVWQGASIKAQLSAEAARRAAAQLG